MTDATDNVSNSNQRTRLQQYYSENHKKLAKFLFEVEGWRAVDIVEKLGLACRATFDRWKKEEGWEKGRMAEIIELTELDARRERARQIGIGTVDQMLKAKELMEAGTTVVEEIQQEDGSTVSKETKMPDYKYQNEGLKRAMELTGTKIERQEIEHKGGQEIIHKYELPAKRPLNLIEGGDDGMQKEIGTQGKDGGKDQQSGEEKTG